MTHGLVPDVSVIMPTYNRSDYIVEAIVSVKKQTYENLELIIVDDGSTDQTEELIKPYLDERCTYHKLAHEGNISRIRNYGIQNSTGAFIAYLDSDDIWGKDKIKAQVEIIRANPGTGMVFTQSKTFHANELNIPLKPAEQVNWRGVSFREILQNEVAIYPSSILYRRQCLTLTGSHDENFRWNDLGFITRVIAHSGGIMIEDALTGIRKHDDNISTVIRSEAVGFRDMIHTTEILFQEGIITKQEKEQITFHFLQRMGNMLCQEKSFRNASVAFKKAMGLRPGFKITIKYALSTLQSILTR